MKAVHVFLDADLRCGHDGLLMLAAKKQVMIQTLAPGSVALFFNVSKNKAKALCGNGLLSYARFEGGITIDALNIFPDAARPGEKLQFSVSVRRQIMKALGEKISVEAA